MSVKHRFQWFVLSVATAIAVYAVLFAVCVIVVGTLYFAARIITPELYLGHTLPSLVCFVIAALLTVYFFARSFIRFILKERKLNGATSKQ